MAAGVTERPWWGMDALFEPDGPLLVPTDLARGPWDPRALHGGPTAALVAWQAERHWAQAPETEWALGRLTIELLRPVPLAPLAVEAVTVRPGRKVTLVAVTVRTGGAQGQEVARAVALGIRRQEVDLPARLTRSQDAPAGPDGLAPAATPEDAAEWPAFHNRGVEMRWASGVWRQPGPATVWIRLCAPVVAGEPVSPAMRAAALADFGNGISSELDFRTWRFLNPELTVHLARPPEGEWIRLEARTLLGDQGAALSDSTLSDLRGPFGRAAQSLLIERG